MGGSAQTVNQQQNTAQTANTQQQQQQQQNYSGTQAGTQAQTGTGSTQANAMAMGLGNTVLGNAQNLGGLFPGLQVANLTDQQRAAINSLFTQGSGLGSLVGQGQGYVGQGANLIGQSGQALTGQDINAFYNPMADSVTRQMQNIFGQQNIANRTDLVNAAGGVGADRIGVGQANLANQQGLAAGQTYAGLYQQALQAAQAQRQQQLAAGMGLAGTGTSAIGTGLGGMGTALGAASLQQQQQQAQNQAAYQQQLGQYGQQYQNLAAQLGALGGLTGLGGTTTQQQLGSTTGQSAGQSAGTSSGTTQGSQLGYGTGSTTYPGASLLSQLVGLGTAGAGAYGALSGAGAGAGATAAGKGAGSGLAALGMLSDERAKTDISKVGKDHDSGLNLYAYRYKGDPKTYPKVVGPMAQEVEKKYPSMVSHLQDGGSVDDEHEDTGLPVQASERADTTRTGMGLGTAGNLMGTGMKMISEAEKHPDVKAIQMPAFNLPALQAMQLQRAPGMAGGGGTDSPFLERPRRLSTVDPSADTFRQRFEPFSSDYMGDALEESLRRHRNIPRTIIKPGYQERFGDPTKVIAGAQDYADGGEVALGSTYSSVPGWPEDYGDAPGSNALGVSDTEQGIALPGRETLGDYYNVRIPGHRKELPELMRQTDIGPARWTGRGIDLSAAGAKNAGLTPEEARATTDKPFMFEPVRAMGSPPGMPEGQENLPGGIDTGRGAGTAMAGRGAGDTDFSAQRRLPGPGGGAGLPPPPSGGMAASPWLALMHAGLGMMAASGQRDARGLPMPALAAIGQGGIKGVETLEAQREQARKDYAELLAKRRMELPYEKMTAHEQAQIGLSREQKNIERDRLKLEKERIDRDRYHPPMMSPFADYAISMPKNPNIDKPIYMPLTPDGQPDPSRATKAAPGSATTVGDSPPAQTSISPVGGKIVSADPVSMVTPPDVRSAVTRDPSIGQLYFDPKSRAAGYKEANDSTKIVAKEAENAMALDTRAKSMRHNLDIITDFAKNNENNPVIRKLLEPGITGEERQKILNTLAYTSPGLVPPNVVAAVNAMGKDSILGGFRNVTSEGLSAREAQPIIKAAMGAMPSFSMPEQSSRVLLASMEQAAQRQKDRQAFLADYRQKNGGFVTGWEAKFNQQFPPERYVAQAIYQSLPSEQKTAKGDVIRKSDFTGAAAQLRQARDAVIAAEQSGNADAANAARQRFMQGKTNFDRYFGGLGNYVVFGTM